MSLADATVDDDMRERRDLVSGRVLDERELVRFAVDPDGQVVPDIAATLPGRGMWVKADRASVTMAAAKNLFAKSAKAQVKAGADLADRVEKLLVARMQSDLGLARRAGQAVLGFDNVMRALDAKVPPAVLIEACDGSFDGRRKIAGAARARGLKTVTVEGLTSAELGLALGRENVIHAALQPGRLAERLVFDAGRLGGFRARPNERDV
ncbi:MAG TPA: RNA-binding protein [Rhizomicrobium sp.]|nr:RNA-binding protein [Rhizomicrobium sp.]